MNIGLILGIIDHVDDALSINRVLLHVLNRQTIGAMTGQLKALCGNIN